MRIFFRIAVNMMHPVHNRIGTRNQVGRTLSYPSQKIK